MLYNLLKFALTGLGTTFNNLELLFSVYLNGEIGGESSDYARGLLALYWISFIC